MMCFGIEPHKFVSVLDMTDFFNTVGELSSYNRDLVSSKLKIVIIWPVMD